MDFVDGEYYERYSINLITGLYVALMEVNTPFVANDEIEQAVKHHRKKNNICITSVNSIEQANLFRKTYVVEDGLAYKQNRLMIRKCQDTIKQYDFIRNFCNYISNPNYIKDLDMNQEKDYYYIADKFEPYKNQNVFKTGRGIRKVTDELLISEMENESMYDQVVLYNNLYLIEFKIKKFLILDETTITTSSFFGFIFKNAFFTNTLDFIERCTHKAVIVMTIKIHRIIHNKNVKFDVHRTNGNLMNKDGLVIANGMEKEINSNMNSYRKYLTYEHEYMKYLMRPYKSKEKELYSIADKKKKKKEKKSEPEYLSHSEIIEPEPFFYVPLSLKINFNSNIFNRDKITKILTNLVKQKNFFNDLYNFYKSILVIKDVDKNYTDQKYFNFIFGEGKNRSECFHAYVNDEFEISRITRIQNVY